MYRIKGNKDLGKVFTAMLNRYYDCVMDRKLPNYFMRLTIFIFPIWQGVIFCWIPFIMPYQVIIPVV